MIIVVSPAKKLDFKTKTDLDIKTQPVLTEHSALLIEELRKCSIEDMTKLMNISYGLAEENIERIIEWDKKINNKSKQAVMAFNGDVYAGLNTKTFTKDDFELAQKKLRIISGLYGILKPCDMIMAYRLPMGTKLANERGKNLYEFWGDIITNEINKTLSENKTNILVNLASNEYFKAINTDKLGGDVVDILFKENKKNVYRVVSFYAKKARGLMARYIIKNKLKNIEDLKSFNLDNYTFDSSQSSKNKLVFVR